MLAAALPFATAGRNVIATRTTASTQIRPSSSSGVTLAYDLLFFDARGLTDLIG
jgi:uncharacterized protein YcfL